MAIQKGCITEKELVAYQIVRDEHEVIIYFNPRISIVEIEDFREISKTIYRESGGKILLVLDLADYGLIKIYINPAIPPKIIGISIDDAIEMATSLIDKSTITV